MIHSPQTGSANPNHDSDQTLQDAHNQLREQYQQLVERLKQLELQRNTDADQAAAQREAPPQQPAGNLVPVAHGEVNAVHNLKFPPFWSGNPALWFAQVEAAFALNNVNGDASRYRHLITQLDSRTLPAIEDIIRNPPAVDKYLTVKARNMSIFADSTESKLRKLLRGLDPSNEKPSLLLQRIRNLADGKVGDALLRTLFMEQLPEYVRGVLAISGDIDLTTLAQQADKVMEATQSSSVSAIQPQQQQESVAAVSRDNAMAEVLAAVASLAKEVKALKSDVQSRSRSSSRHRSANNNTAGNLCYYHARFGDAARKCVSPCAKASNQTGN